MGNRAGNGQAGKDGQKTACPLLSFALYSLQAGNGQKIILPATPRKPAPHKGGQRATGNPLQGGTGFARPLKVGGAIDAPTQ